MLLGGIAIIVVLVVLLVILYAWIGWIGVIFGSMLLGYLLVEGLGLDYIQRRAARPRSVQKGHCPTCGYCLLGNSAATVCPECGKEIPGKLRNELSQLGEKIQDPEDKDKKM